MFAHGSARSPGTAEARRFIYPSARILYTRPIDIISPLSADFTEAANRCCASHATAAVAITQTYEAENG